MLLSREGRALITDFGLARDQRSGRQRLTQTGTILGTPGYMAPEQAEGEPSAVGPSADIYALGATLYALLTGHPPFEGPSTLAILLAVATEAPRPPRARRPELPQDLESVCLRCLEKDPADRYGSTQELLADLERFLRGEPVLATSPTPLDLALRWVKGHPRLARLTATAAVLAAALLAGIPLAGQFVERRAKQVRAELEARKAEALAAAQARLARREEAARRRAADGEAAAAERRLQSAQRSVDHATSMVRATAGGALPPYENWDQAIGILEPVWRQLEDQPEADPARRLVARAYANLLFEDPKGRRLTSDARLVRLDLILSVDPDHVEALSDRSWRTSSSSDGRTSGRDRLADAERAMALGGETPLLLASKASSLSKLGRHPEAIAASAASLARIRAGWTPTEETAYTLLLRKLWEVRGEVLHAAARPAEARAAFDEALDLAVDHLVLYHRGLCSRDLGELDKAREDLLRAIDLYADPNRPERLFSEAALDLASLEARLGRLREAEEILNRLLRASPDDADARIRRAQCRLDLGDLDGASEDLSALRALSKPAPREDRRAEWRRSVERLQRDLTKLRAQR